MIVDEAARRYAGALFEAAGDVAAAERYTGELAEISEALEASPELRRVIEHPLLTPGVKEKVLVRLFGDGLSPEVRQFLTVTFTRGRAAQLTRVAEALRDRVDTALGRHRALVRSVAPLDEAQLSAVRGALEQRLGGEVTLATETDPSLLGGIEVRVGNQVLDLSVARRLRDLGRRLASADGEAGGLRNVRG